MVLKVIINKEPYVGMLLEATQAYHKETFGIIIGKRVKKEKAFSYDTLVQMFVPIKNNSKYTGLTVNNERLEKACSAIPVNSIKQLGDFHTHTTHTTFGPAPSEEDIKDIKNIKNIKSKYYLSFIMQVKPSEAKNTGFLYKNKEIVYITDIYSRRSKSKKTRIKTRLAVFYLNKIKGELKPIKAELEPSRWLLNLMDENPLDKRRKLKAKESLEIIAEAIDVGRQQEH